MRTSVTSEYEDIGRSFEQPDLHVGRILDTTFETRRRNLEGQPALGDSRRPPPVALVVMFAGLANAPRDLAWVLALGAGALLR